MENDIRQWIRLVEHRGRSETGGQIDVKHDADTITTESFEYPASANPERQAKIKQILQILDKNALFAPLRDRIIIFGGVARGNPDAGDIDIMLDFSDQDHGIGFMYYPDIPDIDLFLSLAQKFYGLVDVFIKTKSYMAVRSDDARYWIKANQSRAIWKAAKTEGKPLDVVLASWPSEI